MSNEHRRGRQNRTAVQQGTEREARVAQQSAAVEQALIDVQQVPLQGDAQADAIEANRTAQVARFGSAGVAKTAQAAHAAEAVLQEAALPYTDTVERPVLVPGAQASLQTANRLARAHDREERDITTEAAKAAAKAVRTVLNEQGDEAVHRRYRSVEQHNAAASAAAAKKE